MVYRRKIYGKEVGTNRAAGRRPCDFDDLASLDACQHAFEILLQLANV